MQMQARRVEAAAAASDGRDFALRMEAGNAFLRTDVEGNPGSSGVRRSVPPSWNYRVPTSGYPQGEGPAYRIAADHAGRGGRSRPNRTRCTSTAPPAGVRSTKPQPIFTAGRISLQYVNGRELNVGSPLAGCVASGPGEEAYLR